MFIPLAALEDEKYMLILNDADIEATKEHFGIDNPYITGIVAEIGDGEYNEVYITEWSAPYALTAQYEPITDAYPSLKKWYPHLAHAAQVIKTRCNNRPIR